MRNRKVLWILLLVTILGLSGCKSSKEDVVEDNNTIIEHESQDVIEDSYEVKFEEDVEVESEELEEEMPEIIEEETASDDIWEPTEIVEIDHGEMSRDVVAAFKAALNYIVPSDEADEAAEVSNAILRKTDYQILKSEETKFEMIVSYPNVAKALKELEERIPEDASEKEFNQALMMLALNIDEGEVEMIEKILTFEVEFKDGIWNVVWTKELYDAFSGGLYSVQ